MVANDEVQENVLSHISRTFKSFPECWEMTLKLGDCITYRTVFLDYQIEIILMVRFNCEIAVKQIDYHESRNFEFILNIKQMKFIHKLLDVYHDLISQQYKPLI